MAGEKQHDERHEPAGFTPHTSKAASEYAREQGWDLNEEERRKTPLEKQNYDGGTDYDYGARDFGDTAADTSSAKAEKLSGKDQPSDAGKEGQSLTPRPSDL